MATFGEDWTKTATEAAQTAQDVARHYMDESASFGRAYLRAWSALAQSAVSVGYLQQEAVLQASRSVVEANAQASRDWLNQAADSLHLAQDATNKMVNASAALIDSMVSGTRA